MRMLRNFLAAGLVLLSQAAVASQGNLVLPTTGLVSSVEFSSLVSAAIAALNTCNSGASAPTNASGGVPSAGQCWDDTSGSPTVRKVYDGSTWLTMGAIDASGHIWLPPIGGGIATLASAATVDLCSTNASLISINGTTTVSSFGTGCSTGQMKMVRFDGIFTLTYNALTLTIPGGVSKTTAVGDAIIVVKSSSTRWDVLNYMAAATPPTPSAASAIPVGAMLDYVGFAAPTDFELCDGGTVTRSSSPDYLAAVSSVRTATRLSTGSAVLTSMADTTQLRVGGPIEGTGIPVGATITAITSTTVTMSANATSTGTGDVTFFSVANGNGTTTVGLPDKRGRVFAGRDNMRAAANRLTAASDSACTGDQLGAACGAQTKTLSEPMLPVVSRTVSITISGVTGSSGSHSHDYDGPNTTVNINEGEEGSASSTVANNGTQPMTTAIAPAHTHSFSGSDTDAFTFGSGSAHSIVQPTLIANCIVRVR